MRAMRRADEKNVCFNTLECLHFAQNVVPKVPSHLKGKNRFMREEMKMVTITGTSERFS